MLTFYIHILCDEKITELLLNEAFTLTGNEEDLLDQPTKGAGTTSKWIFGKKWYPSGTLKIWDDKVKNTTPKKVFSHYEYYPCDDYNDIGIPKHIERGRLNDGKYERGKPIEQISQQKKSNERSRSNIRDYERASPIERDDDLRKPIIIGDEITKPESEGKSRRPIETGDGSGRSIYEDRPRIRPIDEQCQRAVYKYEDQSSVGSFVPLEGAQF